MFNAPTTSLCASIPQLKHLNNRLRFLTLSEPHQGHFEEVPRSLTSFTLIPKFSAVFFQPLNDVSERPEIVDNCVDFVSLVVVISNVGDFSNNNFTHTLLEAELDEAVNDCVNGMSEPSLPLTI